jgi:hypothetical protein
VSRSGWCVAVGVDHDALVLPPVRALRHLHVGSGKPPGLRQLVGVVDPDVGRRVGGPRLALGHVPQVDLEAVARRVAVPAASVLSRREAEVLVEGEGGA